MRMAIMERALRHDRLLVAGGLLAAVIAAWAYLISGAGMLQDMDGMLMPMAAGPWTFSAIMLMLFMWAVMMAAMMLPSAAPMILLYTKIARGRAQGAQVPLSSMFASGYIAIWIGFSVGAVALQLALQQLALLSPMMAATNAVFAGLVLVAAGLYQWLPLKRACLQHCRSPLEFVLAHWRRGARGAFAMGARHGLYCLGCCWMLMLLLFVGGVMNMAWIAGLALFVLIEKLAPAGYWIGRGAGLILIAWGLATLLAQARAAGFSLA
jgi:predicted metal-binding membrane protein